LTEQEGHLAEVIAGAAPIDLLAAYPNGGATVDDHVEVRAPDPGSQDAGTLVEELDVQHAVDLMQLGTREVGEQDHLGKFTYRVVLLSHTTPSRGKERRNDLNVADATSLGPWPRLRNRTLGPPLARQGHPSAQPTGR
jgi:hypothetical protein